MNWEKKEDHLVKEFELEDFSGAVNFVNKIVPLANAADHHPDILIHSYKKVKISLTTHDKGEITEKDYDLAKEIDKV
ncbi:MAG TPA: 4a-hydroxytetrahydrobiopterin dehydratase [Prolixibacteraceae bacterium]|nr:4a-hydroxytetrahydrobiopterin dehydratase [Prolixibacteraceae bacterium]